MNYVVPLLLNELDLIENVRHLLAFVKEGVEWSTAKDDENFKFLHMCHL